MLPQTLSILSAAVNQLPVRQLSQPIPVYNVDGSINEASYIQEVADVILHYHTHSERVLLAVTKLGKQNLILGYSWLRKHNPEINWETKEVKMSHCPSGCTTCQDKTQAESQRAQTIA